MDLETLVKTSAAVLVPVLPYLMQKAGDMAADAAVRKVGNTAWQYAQKLWDKLRPKVEAKGGAMEAAEVLACDPDNQDAQGALRMQLRMLFEQEEDLARAVGQLMEEARQAGVSVIASGDRSVAAGGDIRGPVVTGDGNVVESEGDR